METQASLQEIIKNRKGESEGGREEGKEARERSDWEIQERPQEPEEKWGR